LEARHHRQPDGPKVHPGTHLLHLRPVERPVGPLLLLGLHRRPLDRGRLARRASSAEQTHSHAPSSSSRTRLGRAGCPAHASSARCYPLVTYSLDPTGDSPVRKSAPPGVTPVRSLPGEPAARAEAALATVRT